MCVCVCITPLVILRETSSSDLHANPERLSTLRPKTLDPESLNPLQYAFVGVPQGCGHHE